MNIVIVDGYSTGRLLAKELRKAGASCLHVRSAEYIPDYFASGYDPSDYRADFGHVPDLGRLVAGLNAAGVRQVVAGTESGVILADTLNAALGTPGNDPAKVRARRDKADMARTARAAGIATPRGHVCADPRECVDWFGSAAIAGAVVKPLSSAGTDNVWFCASAAEVAAAARRVLASANLYGEANSRVLVQERIRGTEFYVNTVSHEGVHRVAEMWRYVKRAGTEGVPVYDYETPADVRSDDGAVLRDFVFRVLDALGIVSSAAHTEVMLTDAGPVLIETGARLGGATLPGVVERFCGVSQTRLLARTLLDSSHLPAFDDRATAWTAEVRNVSLINHFEGRVTSMSWQDRLMTLPSLVAVSHHVAPGYALPRTTNLLSSPGFVYLAAADPGAVRRDYRALRDYELEGIYTSSRHTAPAIS